MDLSKRFEVNQQLGEGSFSKIYGAFDKKFKSPVALKVEKEDKHKKILKFEYEILKSLQGLPHVPKLYDFIENSQKSVIFGSQEGSFGTKVAKEGREMNKNNIKNNYLNDKKNNSTTSNSEGLNFIVMELLGKNVANYKKSKDGFSALNAYDILLQMLDSIEQLHDRGYIHRDIKPTNFVVREKPNKTVNLLNTETSTLSQSNSVQVYMVDFGLAKIHLDRCLRALPPRLNTDFRGTLTYASLNAHYKKELSRRDDLWSFFFVILDLLNENLPWRTCKDDKDDIKRVKEECLIVPEKKLLLTTTKGKKEILEILLYIKSLNYSDRPNYYFIRNKLNELKLTEMTKLGRSNSNNTINTNASSKTINNNMNTNKRSNCLLYEVPVRKEEYDSPTNFFQQFAMGNNLLLNNCNNNLIRNNNVDPNLPNLQNLPNLPNILNQNYSNYTNNYIPNNIPGMDMNNKSIPSSNIPLLNLNSLNNLNLNMNNYLYNSSYLDSMKKIYHNSLANLNMSTNNKFGFEDNMNNLYNLNNLSFAYKNNNLNLGGFPDMNAFANLSYGLNNFNSLFGNNTNVNNPVNTGMNANATGPQYNNNVLEELEKEKMINRKRKRDNASTLTEDAGAEHKSSTVQQNQIFIINQFNKNQMTELETKLLDFLLKQSNQCNLSNISIPPIESKEYEEINPNYKIVINNERITTSCETKEDKQGTRRKGLNINSNDELLINSITKKLKPPTFNRSTNSKDNIIGNNLYNGYNSQTDFLANVNNIIQNMSSDEINKIISNMNIINGVDSGVNDVKVQKKIFNIEKTKKKY